MASIDFIDPIELTEFARIARDEFDAQSQSLASVFPYRAVNDIRFAFDRGVDAIADAAAFRSFDAESQIARRPAMSRVTGELQPISRKIPLSEYAQLRIRNASNSEIADGVYGDAARLAREIQARIELGRGEILQTGDLALDENGVISTYESGRDPSLTVTTPPTDPWDNHDDADPIADLISWAATVEGVSGVRPNRVIVSPSVMVDLQANDSVKSSVGSTIPAYATQGAVGEAVAGIAGMTIDVVGTMYPLSTPAINEDYVVLWNDTVGAGETLYGTTVESTDPEYQGLGVQPGLVAGAWTEHDPATLWTHAVAIALPLLKNPDTTMAHAVK